LPLLSQSNLLKAALARPSAIFNIISFLHLKETQHYVRSSLVVPPNKKNKPSFPFTVDFSRSWQKHLEHMRLLENRLPKSLSLSELSHIFHIKWGDDPFRPGWTNPKNHIPERWFNTIYRMKFKIATK
jgi:hypothetical protein